MKNPFSFIKDIAAVFLYDTSTPQLTQTKAKHKSIVTRIMEKIRPQKTIVQEQLNLDPFKYATGKEIRHRAMLNYEQTATQRALHMIQYGMENPDDATAQLGKNKAIEYLNRNKELQGKGDLQDYNRQTIAQRWIESDLSSVEGQEERKAAQLNQFNENFGTNLSAEEFDTMARIMATPAFQKQKELLGKQYRVLYEAVADAINDSIDPTRIEKSLSLYTYLGADDYELFSDIVKMDVSAFTVFYEEALTKIGETDRQEPYEINDALWSLAEKYK